MRINSKIDLTRAVRRESMNESLTLSNAASGSFTAGRWLEGTAVTAAITGSVQPASGVEKQMLPELLRTRESIVVFSLSEMKPLVRSAATRPSTLSWHGKTFSVEVLNVFSEHGLYWEALCVSVDQ